jgi:hypothetical protein
MGCNGSHQLTFHILGESWSLEYGSLSGFPFGCAIAEFGQKSFSLLVVDLLLQYELNVRGIKRETDLAIEEPKRSMADNNNSASRICEDECGNVVGIFGEGDLFLKRDPKQIKGCQGGWSHVG